MGQFNGSGVTDNQALFDDRIPKLRSSQKANRMRLSALLSASSEWVGECRVWRRAATDGYGMLLWSGKRQLAHRISYECHVGPIPDGLFIDHLCRNRACINPRHLEPVTNRENILRGVAPAAQFSKRTACSKGHPLSGSNLRIRSDGGRRCFSCQQASERARAPRLRKVLVEAA